MDYNKAQAPQLKILVNVTMLLFQLLLIKVRIEKWFLQKGGKADKFEPNRFFK